MRFVSVRAMRDLDRLSIETHGVPGGVLMERAGLGVAEWCARLAEAMGARAPILIAAGCGNNGGDGFVAARALRRMGHGVDVLVCGTHAALRGDALAAFERYCAEGGESRFLPDSGDWTPDVLGIAAHGGVLVDALLGTGARGAPRGGVGAAVRTLAAVAGRCRVVAVDAPSGLDADTGRAPGDVVTADLTLTLGLPKRGFREHCAWPYCGRVEAIDIGLAPLPEGWGDDGERLLATPDMRILVPRREREDHKGMFGHVVIVAGSRGFGGAPALCARGCLKAGAGLVTVATPDECAFAVGSGVPEAMVHPIESDAGHLRLEALLAWLDSRPAADVLVLGPGMGQGEALRAMIARLSAYGRARVLDADALNGIAKDVARGPFRLAEGTVLTPHPGEAARLLGVETGTVQADRLRAVEALVERTGAVVVLKGAGTLVAAPGRTPRLSLGGNPGMATGGAGDVLAGIVGGLLAQGMAPFDAACLGVYLHAAAGDQTAWREGEAALTAGELPDGIGPVMRWLRVR